MDNRRAHPRFELALLALTNAGPEAAADKRLPADAAMQLQDLSRGGVRFLSSQSFALQGHISFTWEEGAAQGTVLACDPVPSDPPSYAVRAVFEEPLPLPLVGLLLVQADLGEVPAVRAAQQQ